MTLIQKFFRVSADEWAAIERQAKAEERTPSAIVRRALRLYLSDAYSKESPDPVTRAGLWLTALPETVRKDVVRIGESLAAHVTGEGTGDAPPPLPGDTAPGTPQAVDTQRTTPTTAGKKRRPGKGRG